MRSYFRRLGVGALLATASVRCTGSDTVAPAHAAVSSHAAVHPLPTVNPVAGRHPTYSTAAGPVRAADASDPVVSTLAGTTQSVSWYYFQNGSDWYIGSTAGALYLLEGIDPSSPDGIVWKPINDAPSRSGYPDAPSNYAYVTVATDGQSVAIGPVINLANTDPDMRLIANTTQPVSWFFVRHPATQLWYIVAPTGEQVLQLDHVDATMLGGIGWRPVNRATYQGYPPAGANYAYVTPSADGRSISIGPLATLAPSSVSVTDLLPHRVVVLNGEQTITLRGSGFSPGVTVTAGATGWSVTLPPVAVNVVRPDSMQVLISVGTEPNSSWFLQLTNPGEMPSDRIGFSVQTPASYPDDTYIGELKGVPIFSETDTRSVRHSCVEYIGRYYQTKFPRTNGDAGIRHLRDGDAKNYYWYGSEKGLKTAPNGGPFDPRVDNILVFDNGNPLRDDPTAIGHVAIISEVGPNYLVVAQQNWTNPTTLVQQAYMRLQMDVTTAADGTLRYYVHPPPTDSKYTVSKYTVVGWAWPDASQYGP